MSKENKNTTLTVLFNQSREKPFLTSQGALRPLSKLEIPKEEADKLLKLYPSDLIVFGLCDVINANEETVAENKALRARADEALEALANTTEKLKLITSEKEALELRIASIEQKAKQKSQSAD